MSNSEKPLNEIWPNVFSRVFDWVQQVTQGYIDRGVVSEGICWSHNPVVYNPSKRSGNLENPKDFEGK